ncbi:fatty acid desaturase [Nodularia sp. UHCC 0506]|uniref:fatty acid desaturase family protein n=1 Tax=Nodularia sp. UHCC 0506 TaxID=3110243 RepID=UPI002B2076D3|nr:fatty acid desaturase [Nodularia sp. UHCC 0506]MEA5514256.1 fatty acid desaturase [Nodularia sp. UHCC 0506]
MHKIFSKYPRQVQKKERLFQKNNLYNIIVIVYVLVSYLSAFLLLPAQQIFFNILGILLLTHSLVISAYLFHEFIHGTIFTSKKWNVIGGNVMLWLNGGCYARFEDLAKEHICHHVNKFDSSAFDLSKFLKKLPTLVQIFVIALEWMYFPVIYFFLQFYSITAPFWKPERKHERVRILFVLFVRGIFFTSMGLISLKFLLLYFFSYIGMITVMRFMDAFQHTYQMFPPGASPPKYNSLYEQENTFSILISRKYWWLNLLTLNFGYHNAHHARMRCPWYNLHKLDAELSKKTKIHYPSFTNLLYNYHRFRVIRLFSGQGQVYKDNWNNFYGAVGVSVLIKH